MLADFRAIADSLHMRPTRMRELIPTAPTYIGACDAYGHGMGGVWFHTSPYITTHHTPPFCGDKFSTIRHNARSLRLIGPRERSRFPTSILWPSLPIRRCWRNATRSRNIHSGWPRITKPPCRGRRKDRPRQQQHAPTFSFIIRSTSADIAT
jgi:hypothetical protein